MLCHMFPILIYFIANGKTDRNVSEWRLLTSRKV
uniref:Bm14471 n=1 Tax=Brugia malayi TaxID=6279 RepID=A0A1I9G376_BRUMA|nr:Bm14471 [Brugia malayi]